MLVFWLKHVHSSQYVTIMPLSHCYQRLSVASFLSYSAVLFETQTSKLVPLPSQTQSHCLKQNNGLIHLPELVCDQYQSTEKIQCLLPNSLTKLISEQVCCQGTTMKNHWRSVVRECHRLVSLTANSNQTVFSDDDR